jgi:hypothetical protein
VRKGEFGGDFKRLKGVAVWNSRGDCEIVSFEVDLPDIPPPRKSSASAVSKMRRGLKF